MTECESIDCDRRIADRAAEIYSTLRRKGMLVEDADILIAATALEHGLSMVTGNTRHFLRIEGLIL
ncbi:MAG: PIN domain-containing protein [Desulfonatronovibrio sp.]